MKIKVRNNNAKKNILKKLLTCFSQNVDFEFKEVRKEMQKKILKRYSNIGFFETQTLGAE